MSTHLSKSCSDFLRKSYGVSGNGKLKATHARELVAAFFGYKSHAALIADQVCPVDKLEEARILVPDIPLLDQRRVRLKDLPSELLSSRELAQALCSFLQEEGYFGGDVWLYESLENYVIEVLLIENDVLIMDKLSGVMAETNACFDEACYETVSSSDEGLELVVSVEGTYGGSNHDDKPFCGDRIDMQVTVTFHLVAGRRGFLDYGISAGGTVNDDWVDPALKYSDQSNMRPKEQFIAMTGGFRFAESQAQFRKRQREILAVRQKISAGAATVQDVDALSQLLGTDDDEDGIIY